MNTPPLHRRLWHAARLLLALVLCAALGVVAWLVLGPRHPRAPEAALPNPNGHDDFVAAGRALSGREPKWETATSEQMRGYVSSNAAALSRLRVGLTRPARVPVEFTPDYTDRRLEELTFTKRLALLLRTEARVFEADRQVDEALRSGLDALRFSHESVRGGLLIDLMVGVACERMALDSLERVLGTLDPSECRHAIQVIQDVEASREPTADVLAREHACARRVLGWRGAVLRIMPGQAQSQLQAEQRATARREESDRERGALLIRLASRACRLETGRSPKAWDELVPRYLERTPVDPTTQQPLPLDLGTAE